MQLLSYSTFTECQALTSKCFTHWDFTRTLWNKISYLLVPFYWWEKKFSYFAKVTELGSDGTKIPNQSSSRAQTTQQIYQIDVLCVIQMWYWVLFYNFLSIIFVSIFASTINLWFSFSRNIFSMFQYQCYFPFIKQFGNFHFLSSETV